MCGCRCGASALLCSRLLSPTAPTHMSHAQNVWPPPAQHRRIRRLRCQWQQAPERPPEPARARRSVHHRFGGYHIGIDEQGRHVLVPRGPRSFFKPPGAVRAASPSVRGSCLFLGLVLVSAYIHVRVLRLPLGLGQIFFLAPPKSLFHSFFVVFSSGPNSLEIFFFRGPNSLKRCSSHVVLPLGLDRIRRFWVVWGRADAR